MTPVEPDRYLVVEHDGRTVAGLPGQIAREIGAACRDHGEAAAVLTDLLRAGRLRVVELGPELGDVN